MCGGDVKVKEKKVREEARTRNKMWWSFKFSGRAKLKKT